MRLDDRICRPEHRGFPSPFRPFRCIGLLKLIFALIALSAYKHLRRHSSLHAMVNAPTCWTVQVSGRELTRLSFDATQRPYPPSRRFISLGVAILEYGTSTWQLTCSIPPDATRWILPAEAIHTCPLLSVREVGPQIRYMHTSRRVTHGEGASLTMQRPTTPFAEAVRLLSLAHHTHP